MDDPTFKQALDGMGVFRKKLRFHTFLNCWHINEIESDVMWKIYVKNNVGIAIQSTYKRLVDCLKEYDQINIGSVNYIDYEIEPITEDNTFWSYIYKKIVLNMNKS